jgi:1-phosphatidylinositol-3-phosphate 5-kinase
MPSTSSSFATSPAQSRQNWMSDKNCSVCYDCGLPFHFWRRRHHCRLCGQIFCNGQHEQSN